jgi:hypothetical protein
MLFPNRPVASAVYIMIGRLLLLVGGVLSVFRITRTVGLTLLLVSLFYIVLGGVILCWKQLPGQTKS